MKLVQLFVTPSELLLPSFTAVTGRFRRGGGGSSQTGFSQRHLVFITSSCRRGFAVELEPSSLTPPDFTVAASSPPPLSTVLLFVELSSLTFRIPRLALCNLSSISAPLPSRAAILHFWVGGLQETAHGDSQYRMLIRPSATLPTIFLPDMSFCFVIDSIIIRRFP